MITLTEILDVRERVRSVLKLPFSQPDTFWNLP